MKNNIIGSKSLTVREKKIIKTGSEEEKIYSTISKTTSLNFLSILGPSQKESGRGGWYWTVYGSHLTCRNLDSF